MPKDSHAIPVSDRPAEIWIKLLVFVTSVAVALITYMGNRGIVGQDMLIEGQNRKTEAVGKINGNLQTINSRVSRNEKDIQELQSFHVNIQNGLKP